MKISAIPNLSFPIRYLVLIVECPEFRTTASQLVNGLVYYTGFYSLIQR